jgi:hypothetical protein
MAIFAKTLCSALINLWRLITLPNQNNTKEYSHDAGKAQQLYSSQPDVTPELGKRGSYSVGVTTIQATNPQQLSAKDYQSLEDRTLTLEVWYPADIKETDI